MGGLSCFEGSALRTANGKLIHVSRRMRSHVFHAGHNAITYMLDKPQCSVSGFIESVVKPMGKLSGSIDTLPRCLALAAVGASHPVLSIGVQGIIRRP